jgi:hypothetical protein
MSNEAELVGRIAASLAPDSQEQPEPSDVEAPETEVVDETVEVDEVSDVEVGDEPIEDVEGVNDDSQELASSDDEDEFFYQIGDKEYSASEVESWKDNGLRQSDYTQKTQKLAEDRKTFDADVKAQKSELQSSIDAVRDLVKVEGDWEMGDDGLPLYDEDMPKFQRAKAKQDQINKLLSDAASKTQVTRTAEDVQSLNTALLTQFPEWADEAARGKDLTVMSEYLTSVGFGDEFSNSVDPRMYQLIKDASIGRKVSESGASITKKVRAAPKIVKPKQAKQAAKRTQHQEARDRFRKSGGKNDRAGVELFKQFV